MPVAEYIQAEAWSASVEVDILVIQVITEVVAIDVEICLE